MGRVKKIRQGIGEGDVAEGRMQQMGGDVEKMEG